MFISSVKSWTQEVSDLNFLFVVFLMQLPANIPHICGVKSHLLHKLQNYVIRRFILLIILGVSKHWVLGILVFLVHVHGWRGSGLMNETRAEGKDYLTKAGYYYLKIVNVSHDNVSAESFQSRFQVSYVVVSFKPLN